METSSRAALVITGPLPTAVITQRLGLVPTEVAEALLTIGPATLGRLAAAGGALVLDVYDSAGE